MRKYLTYSFLYIAGALTLLSCDGKLDIKPEDTLVETDVFAEEALAARALGEAYFKFAQVSTSTVYNYGDFTTNITQTQNAEFYTKFINADLNPEDETVADFWLRYYGVVNAANGLIFNIPVYGKYSLAAQNQHIAEAKFIRAFAYLRLLTLFGEGALTQDMTGMGVPLQLGIYDGYNEEDELLPRASVQAVYDQIIQDLTEAAEVVPASYGTSSLRNLDTRSRATKGGCYALLSRVYLYMGDYENAAEYAQLVLDLSTVYELTEDITVLFPNNAVNEPGSMNKEYIFGLPYSRETMGSNNLGYSYWYKLFYWADVTNFIEKMPVDDLRRTDLIFIGDTQYNQETVADRLTTIKFSDVRQYDNVPMIRLAEIILTRAEALARTEGINQESVDLLNDIYIRANPEEDDYLVEDFANPQQLLDTILREREYELAFEGLHRYDLIRTGRSLRNPDLTDGQKVLPIPQVDITLSKGVIKQNSAY